MKKSALKFLIILSVFSISISLYAQGAKGSDEVTWKPEETKTPELSLFHSIYSISLPTAEVMQKGDYFYSISHRFVSPTSSGPLYLWGVDGSVNMRMEVGYGITDKLMANLSRSNQDGNWEFNLKYKAITYQNDIMPIVAGINVGGAYNSKFPDYYRPYQFFGQIMINGMLFKKLGIGIVPSMLLNADPTKDPAYKAFTLGVHAQYYINEMWAVILETNQTTNGWMGSNYNSYAAGVELETGGHFFKFIFSNNTMLNQSQYLAGSPKNWDKYGIHFGFQITRNL